MAEAAAKLTKKDFESNQEVRWCPGCGDYSILATVQRFLPTLDIPRENHVFVSGIGCAARFPYYMNTYGFHTIHGRAPAFASGLKLANPDLTVWIISGDGDSLSIGGNHLLHILRRNVNVNILLFNNKIYGLTKGQYSPTSESGKITKSTPHGSIETPLNPIKVALAAGASFVARSYDVDAKGLSSILAEAVAHKGTSIVEILQNCNVFNDGAHVQIRERENRAKNQLQMIDGQPLVFGAESEHGIALDGLTPKKVSAGTDVLKHDVSSKAAAMMLSELELPEFPLPFGVFYREERPCYEDVAHEQISAAQGKASSDLQSLINGSDSWVVS